MREEVTFLIEFLKAYSPTGNVEKAVKVFCNEALKLGFVPEMDSLGNVICEIGQGNSVILLCGHIDTVEKEIPVTVRGNIISGRGAVDAKSSLAAMLYAMRKVRPLVEKNKSFKVVLAGVIDEEGSSEGVREIIKRFRSIDVAVVGEPTRTYGIAISYRGRIFFRVHAHGTRAHISAYRKFGNPIERIMEFWSNLSKYLRNKYRGEIIGGPVKIEGGCFDNVLPESCDMAVDLRIPPALDVHELLDNIRNLASTTNVLIENLSFVPPFETSPGNPIVASFLNAIRRILKRDPVILRKSGTCDANIIASQLKIPVVVYGPGNPRLSHTDIERISIEEYLLSIEVLSAAISEYIEKNARKST
ncbi:MAG: M20/M25/M40 family metallo-hydrolase [Candidatus Baldrarchaeia archaeon]